MSSTTVLSAMVITCLVIVVLVALAKPLQGLFRFLLWEFWALPCSFF